LAAAHLFCTSGIDAAARAIAAQEIGYREFCERIAAAGWVGYLASMAGHRAVYHGRTGQSHVELFLRVVS